ncbi:MAG TPA: pseudouridine-5'-phosphate glycosidase, partial [Blastocatellia bacterium]|nr:pseudouridine-5'-phosphate glycosidase [Blastocatellia bacterium]
GLPHPLNIETARSCEEAIRRAGATPATIAIVEGCCKAGLDEGEIATLARAVSPDGKPVEKVGLNNLSGLLVRGGWGATTGAATMRIASLAGIKVFATGGIGGVHRGAAESFDVSADLTALSRIPMICVSAGAKAILDLPKTREYLETMGVPVVGFGTDEFPAFYSRHSGLGVDIAVETPEEAAAVAVRHWQTGGAGAVLVCAPIPEQFEIEQEEIENAVEEAMRLAEQAGARGKALTPFLLSQMEKLTGGRTLAANRALLLNNAEIAARIEESRIQNPESRSC